ncbi:MAG: hypothetical protein LQ345_003155, partial [Seirophora villosa]
MKQIILLDSAVLLLAVLDTASGYAFNQRHYAAGNSSEPSSTGTMLSAATPKPLTQRNSTSEEPVSEIADGQIQAHTLTSISRSSAPQTTVSSNSSSSTVPQLTTPSTNKTTSALTESHASSGFPIAPSQHASSGPYPFKNSTTSVEPTGTAVPVKPSTSHGTGHQASHTPILHGSAVSYANSSIPATKPVHISTGSYTHVTGGHGSPTTPTTELHFTTLTPTTPTTIVVPFSVGATTVVCPSSAASSILSIAST